MSDYFGRLLKNRIRNKQQRMKRPVRPAEMHSATSLVRYMGAKRLSSLVNRLGEQIDGGHELESTKTFQSIMKLIGGAQEKAMRVKTSPKPPAPPKPKQIGLGNKSSQMLKALEPTPRPNPVTPKSIVSYQQAYAPEVKRLFETPWHKLAAEEPSGFDQIHGIAAGDSKSGHPDQANAWHGLASAVGHYLGEEGPSSNTARLFKTMVSTGARAAHGLGSKVPENQVARHAIVFLRSKGYGDPVKPAEHNEYRGFVSDWLPPTEKMDSESPSTFHSNNQSRRIEKMHTAFENAFTHHMMERVNEDIRKAAKSPRFKITEDMAEDFVQRHKLDLSKLHISVMDLVTGGNVELEHGSVDPQTDVTHDNEDMTLKIALAHLKEDPKYYQKLAKFDKAQKEIPDPPKKSKDPQLFTMVRHGDESGVSGTGRVADGVVWPNGKVTLTWRGDKSSTTQFDSFKRFLAIHIIPHPTNHTEITWLK